MLLEVLNEEYLCQNLFLTCQNIKGKGFIYSNFSGDYQKCKCNFKLKSSFLSWQEIFNFPNTIVFAFKLKWIEINVENFNYAFRIHWLVAYKSHGLSVIQVM